MRVLVTGGAGFIGSHLAEAYLREGHVVTVLDDLSSGRRDNLPSGVTLVEAGITDARQVERLFASFQPELVSHHAAQIDVRRSVEDPLLDAEINIKGLITLAQAAVRHGKPSFIFASSGGAVYGEQSVFPAAEDHRTDPLSPYGISKLAGEKYLFFFREVMGLRTVILRYSNVYGPRQDPHGEAGVVAIFSTRLLAGRDLTINGDGEQTRDYIYVGDVVSANMAVSRAGIEGTFNVGTGREISVNDLAAILVGLAGGTPRLTHGPAKAGEQKRSVVDASRLASTTGWRPLTALEAGLERTFSYFKEKAI